MENCVMIQPYITELDLRHSLVPEEIIQQLKETLPPAHPIPNHHHDDDDDESRRGRRTDNTHPGDGADDVVDDDDVEDADVPKYDYVAFMENITSNSSRPPPPTPHHLSSETRGTGMNGIRNGHHGHGHGHHS